MRRLLYKKAALFFCRPSHVIFVNMLPDFRQSLPYDSTLAALKTAMIAGGILSFVLIFFQPFGTYEFSAIGKYWKLAGYGLVLALVFLVVHVLFWPWRRGWNLGRELLFQSVFVLSGGVFCKLYHVALGFGPWNLQELLYFLFFALIIAFIPVFFLVRSKLQKADFAWRLSEAQLKAGVTALATEQESQLISLQGRGQGEKWQGRQNDLHYLKAEGNYVAVFYAREGRSDKMLLRGALSEVAAQLSDEDFMQIHRSFVVNLRQASSLSVQSSGYVLKLRGGEILPVSRNQVKGLRARLEQK
jgi:LytTr DNA-binding domain